jgi:hypothetical protein
LAPTVEASPDLSPKEVFLLREKGFKIKMGVLLILNNLFWLTIFFTPEEEIRSKKPLPVKAGYEIVKLPAQIFTETPHEGKRLHVTLKHHSSSFKTHGYLRDVLSDAYGATGSKIVVEIQKKDLEKLNSLNSYWLVYPFFKQKEKVITKKTRRLHEVIF